VRISSGLGRVPALRAHTLLSCNMLPMSARLLLLLLLLLSCRRGTRMSSSRRAT
jgi:hypothetical protein